MGPIKNFHGQKSALARPEHAHPIIGRCHALTLSGRRYTLIWAETLGAPVVCFKILSKTISNLVGEEADHAAQGALGDGQILGIDVADDRQLRRLRLQ